MIPVLIAILASSAIFTFLFVVTWEDFLSEEGDKFHPVNFFGQKMSAEKFAAGTLMYISGIAMLMAWTYFAITEYKFFAIQDRTLIPYVYLEFANAILLMLGGHSVLRGWRRQKPIFFSVVGLSLVSLITTLYAYASRGYPLHMHILSEIVVVIGAFISSILYFVDIVMFSGDMNAADEKTLDDLGAISHMKHPGQHPHQPAA